MILLVSNFIVLMIVAITSNPKNKLESFTRDLSIFVAGMFLVFILDKLI